jgi:hypothetical protein
MKSMLQHSFVLDALETTAADTFSHFEVLIEEHRRLDTQQHHRQSSSFGVSTSSDIVVPNHNIHNTSSSMHSSSHHHRHHSNAVTPMKQQQSRLQQLVPTIGSFHTPLPLREAFEIYNEKHRLVC